MKRIAILIVAAALFFSVSAFADQVTLKNGDRLTGKIEKSDGKVLLVKSDFAGDVSVQWGAVESIASTQPLFLTLKDGQTLAGTVATTDGKFVVTTKDAGTVTTAKEDVGIIRNDVEQTAYDAQIERLKNPHLTDFWGGYIDTALSVSRGNADTLNFVLAGRAVRTTSRDTISVYANSIFSDRKSTRLNSSHH